MIIMVDGGKGVFSFLVKILNNLYCLQQSLHGSYKTLEVSADFQKFSA